MRIMQTLLEGGTKKVQKKKEATLYAIGGTAVLLAISLVLLLVVGIATVIAENKAKEPEEPVADIGPTKTVTLSEEQLHEGTLLTLDDEHPYVGDAHVVLMKDIERPQTSGNTNVYTIGGMSTLCGTAEAINALNDMIGAFYKSSKDDNIYIANAHNKESGAAQDAIYINGTAFELKYFSAAAEEDWSKKDSIYGVSTYNWIYNNAHKYGFIAVSNSNGSGSNVFRYVGIVHATAIKTQKLVTVERYLDMLKSTSPESPLSITLSGATYGVYYLSAAGEHKVPVNYDYTVSGNNVDGYVITVKTTK